MGHESSVRFLTLGNGGLCYFDLRLSGDCGRDAGRVGALVGSPICLLQWDLARL